MDSRGPGYLNLVGRWDGDPILKSLMEHVKTRIRHSPKGLFLIQYLLFQVDWKCNKE